MTLRAFLEGLGVDVEALLAKEDFGLSATVPDFQTVVEAKVDEVEITLDVTTPRPKS